MNFEDLSMKEIKYPIEFVGKDEIEHIELNLTNKERILIFNLCRDKYLNTVDYINSNKEGFKKILFSPFHDRPHTIPISKNNTCFMPVKQLPRIHNLRKIFPTLANNGINMIINHERQHCLSNAFEIHKNANGDSCSVSNTKRIENEANKQVCNSLRNKITEKDFIKKITSFFIAINVFKNGAKNIENELKENDFINWLNAYNSSIVNKTGDLSLYINEFNNLKNELLGRYKKYIANNNINNFYNEEDKECEKLRIEAINELNKLHEQKLS